MNEKRKFIHMIGGYCQNFRKRILVKTLKELAEENDIPVPTLSSFENGRSSSLNVFYVYLVSCETQREQTIFINEINRLFYDVWSMK